jgi:hypothetical protein
MYNRGVDGYNFEKLAREIVAGRLAGLADRAPEAAAEIAKRILIAALQSTREKQDPRESVEAICRGVLGGLMLINQDLSRAAPLILKELGHVSHEVPLSPEDLMTWAMDGFAQVAVLAGDDSPLKIENAIDASFMGAGRVFATACARERAKAGA